jgi:hypothetical protein
MEQLTTGGIEAVEIIDIHSAGREISRLSWNSTIYHVVRKSCPLQHPAAAAEHCKPPLV